MTPTLLSRSQISDTLWNDLIKHSRQSVIYAFSNYLDLVSESWNALVWTEMDEYQIVMPIPIRKKFGKRVAYQPLFCQYLGIFSRSELTPSQANAFLREFSQRFSYISAYHFNPENHYLLTGLVASVPDLLTSIFKTHWIDLRRDYPTIRNTFSKDRKNNLRKAERVGWSIKKSRNVHPLIYLFVQNHASKLRGGVNPDAYNRLEMLFTKLEAIDKAELWYAHYDGRIRAGILLVRNDSRVIYLFNAADEVGRLGNARTFLLAEYFRTHSGEDLMFDFESAEVESISAFYKSFGSKEMPYLNVNKNKLWPPLRLLQNLRKATLFKTR